MVQMKISFSVILLQKYCMQFKIQQENGRGVEFLASVLGASTLVGCCQPLPSIVTTVVVEARNCQGVVQKQVVFQLLITFSFWPQEDNPSSWKRKGINSTTASQRRSDLVFLTSPLDKDNEHRTRKKLFNVGFLPILNVCTFNKYSIEYILLVCNVAFLIGALFELVSTMSGVWKGNLISA